MNNEKPKRRAHHNRTPLKNEEGMQNYGKLGQFTILKKSSIVEPAEQNCHP